MRCLLILATLLIAYPVVGCSTISRTGKEFIESGKDVGIENPIGVSRKKLSLNEARQAVQKSRRELDNCLTDNSGDESRCQREKDKYAADVEEYATLQTK